MLTFCNSYVLWLLRCVQLRLVTVTFCDVNVVWCYILSQYCLDPYCSVVIEWDWHTNAGKNAGSGRTGLLSLVHVDWSVLEVQILYNWKLTTFFTSKTSTVTSDHSFLNACKQRGLLYAYKPCMLHAAYMNAKVRMYVRVQYTSTCTVYSTHRRKSSRQWKAESDAIIWWTLISSFRF
jgi:hypothetical protein